MAAKKKAAKKKVTKKRATKKKAAPKFEPRDEAEAIKGSAFDLREDLYCEAYVGQCRGNKKKAAITAGYAPTTAQTNVNSIHRLPWIQKRIELLRDEVIAELKMSPDEIEAEWGAIGRFDIRNLYDSNGRLLHPDEMDDATARAISSIKVRAEFEGRGDEREHVADIIEVKVVDKNTALSNYARAHGMFKDVVTVDPSENMRKLLEAIDGTSLGPPALRSGKAGED